MDLLLVGNHTSCRYNNFSANNVFLFKKNRKLSVLLNKMVSKSPKKTVGSRAQVMHGNAKRTSGGLTKRNLKRNKWGRIVSRRKSSLAKKQNFLKEYKDMRFARRSPRRSRRKTRSASRRSCKYGRLKSPRGRRRCRNRRSCKNGRLKSPRGRRQCKKSRRKSRSRRR